MVACDASRAGFAFDNASILTFQLRLTRVYPNAIVLYGSIRIRCYRITCVEFITPSDCIIAVYAELVNQRYDMRM